MPLSHFVRCPLILPLLCLLLATPQVSRAASPYTTANFIVYAPTPQIAQKVGETAEKWRRIKAQEWLGSEMPAWGKKCPLHVTVTPVGPSGETTFAFDGGAILDQEMHVAGPLDRILDSVLPHEITHTVFAYKFRQPLPRWADEGGSVLSEDDLERRKHDEMIRTLLVQGNKAYRLRALLTMMRYPTNGEDVLTLYAEGYSVCRFLVESSSRQTFLEFLGDGVRPNVGWDRALQKHYQLNNIEQLETAWLRWMREWFSPQARLHSAGASDKTVALTVAPTPQQSQASRVPTPSEAPRGQIGSATTMRANDPESTNRDVPTSYPRQDSPRPWSAVSEAPPPTPVNPGSNVPGWRPIRATLNSAIPLPD